MLQGDGIHVAEANMIVAILVSAAGVLLATWALLPDVRSWIGSTLLRRDSDRDCKGCVDEEMGQIGDTPKMTMPRRARAAFSDRPGSGQASLYSHYFCPP